MWILLALILIMPFEANPYLYLSSSFLGILPDFTMIKLVGLVGLVWAAFKVGTSSTTLGILDSRQTRYFFAFVFVVVVACLLNGVVMRPVSRLLSIVLLLPLVLAAVRNERNLILALQMTAGSLILVFPYGYRNMGRFGGRYGTGLYEPNYLALALVLVLPLAVVLARHASTVWRRRAWKIGTIVILISIVLTGSRGGFVGTLVVAALLVFKLSKQPVASLFRMAVVLLAIMIFVPNPLVDRLFASRASDTVQSGVEWSNRARLEAMSGGLRMIRERPFTGVGLGNFKPTMETYTDVEMAKIAHNTYLEVAAELGLPALFVFLLIMWATLRSLSRSAREARRAGADHLRDLALAMQVGLLGYLTSALFLSAQFEKYLWLVVFLSICVERVVKRQTVRREAEPSLAGRLGVGRKAYA